jgi:hypothetical protein
MTNSSDQNNGPPQVPPSGYYQHPGYPPSYPAPGYFQQPQKPKRPVWPWVLGGILLTIFLGVGGCFAFVGLVANGIDAESKREVTVTYEVTGTGDSVAVTYSGRDFNTAQETGVGLPWRKDVVIDGLGKTVILTGTRSMGDGTVTCRISANGKVVSEQTSSGPFASASCMGNANE